jgi:hypothetical protein
MKLTLMIVLPAMLLAGGICNLPAADPPPPLAPLAPPKPIAPPPPTNLTPPQPIQPSAPGGLRPSITNPPGGSNTNRYQPFTTNGIRGSTNRFGTPTNAPGPDKP